MSRRHNRMGRSRMIPTAILGGAVCMLCLPAAVNAQCHTLWTAITSSPSPPPAPTARGYSGIAFDPAGARVLVYGGGTNSAGFRDLWQWNGISWSNLGIGAPGTRKGPAMTWDTARSRAVLFGGAFTTTNDTWEWDGGGWSQAATSGPPLRGFTSMVYDGARSRCVLFGGWSSGFNYFNDTWAWSGTAWSQVAPGPSVPHARGFHAMAYDSNRDRIVLFGGLWNDASSSNVLGDTWEFDGSDWIEMTGGSSPPPRAYHAMSYDPVGRRVILHGGFEIGHGAFNDTWAYDARGWSQIDNGVPAPIGRQAFSMIFDAARSKFMVFGGVLGSTFRNDVWTMTTPTCCIADVDDGGGTGMPDGGVTIDDLLYYLYTFEAGDVVADVDDGTSTGTPDGGVTIDDLLYYLIRFEAGC